jgi:hypothetical protein
LTWLAARARKSKTRRPLILSPPSPQDIRSNPVKRRYLAN